MLAPLEIGTTALRKNAARGSPSEGWNPVAIAAGEGIRTLDPNLGKVVRSKRFQGLK